MPAFLVLKQIEGGNWQPVSADAVEAVTADAAIEATRTSPGTFVAVLVRSFRPRTHYAPPKPAAQNKEAT